MDLLHKGRLSIDDAVQAKHPVDLGDDEPGIRDMLQHGLCYDRIDTAVRQRNLMRVGDELRELTRFHVVDSG
ncbi:hypothetical protein H4W80_000551 [Nonomuraea angiospora]|uniref:Uncharacterized protein n=1 Tax=Nonomuraea angiospora TaxID=46172 RepID=A0ABR9LNP9_9ACTN|nr:hypothetical protein [Nonomuraea angiospora]MBE1582293.1 hypothetical protein [Nonomuraea angiospora]